MTNDRDQELERLEKELWAEMPKEEDDLLADLPIELLDTAPLTWPEENLLADTDLLIDDDLLADAELPTNENPLSEADLLVISPKDLEDYFQESESKGDTMKQVQQKPVRNSKKAKAREDRWVVWLMAVASFLSLGIISVLIYWLEVFLK